MVEGEYLAPPFLNHLTTWVDHDNPAISKIKTQPYITLFKEFFKYVTIKP